MTTLAPATAADGTIQLATVKVRHWKMAISLGITTVLLFLLFLLVPRDGVSTFRLSDRSSSLEIPNVSVPTAATSWGVLVVLVLLTLWAVWNAWSYRRTGVWLPIVYGVLAIFAFLTWAAAGGLVPVTGLLFGAVSLSVPLIFGALGGVIGERVGVVNVAIEGQFLLGAFSAALISSITGNPFVGLLGAMVGGVLVAFVLAAFSIAHPFTTPDGSRLVPFGAGTASASKAPLVSWRRRSHKSRTSRTSSDTSPRVSSPAPRREISLSRRYVLNVAST